VTPPPTLMPAVKSNPLFQPDSTMRTYTNHVFSDFGAPSPSPARPAAAAKVSRLDDEDQLPRWGAKAARSSLGTPPEVTSTKVLQPKRDNERAVSVERINALSNKRTPSSSDARLPVGGVSNKRARTTATVTTKGPLDSFFLRHTGASTWTSEDFAIGVGSGCTSSKSRVQPPKLKLAPLMRRPASSTPLAVGSSGRQNSLAGGPVALLAATSGRLVTAAASLSANCREHKYSSA
jgi:hypothetical protein